MEKKKGLNTRSVHDGELKDELYEGAVSPIYLIILKEMMINIQDILIHLIN